MYDSYAEHSDVPEKEQYGISAERQTFLMRVYGHVFGAMIAFIVLEVILFKTGIAEQLVGAMMGVRG